MKAFGPFVACDRFSVRASLITHYKKVDGGVIAYFLRGEEELQLTLPVDREVFEASLLRALSWRPEQAQDEGGGAARKLEYARGWVIAELTKASSHADRLRHAVLREVLDIVDPPPVSAAEEA